MSSKRLAELSVGQSSASNSSSYTSDDSNYLEERSSSDLSIEDSSSSNNRLRASSSNSKNNNNNNNNNGNDSDEDDDFTLMRFLREVPLPPQYIAEQSERGDGIDFDEEEYYNENGDYDPVLKWRKQRIKKRQEEDLIRMKEKQKLFVLLRTFSG